MAQDPRNEYHRPVMSDEVVEMIRPVLPGVVVDATFGGGGHSPRMMEEFGDRVQMVAIDRDPDAVANAEDLGVSAVEGNFADLGSLVASVTDEED